MITFEKDKNSQETTFGKMLPGKWYASTACECFKILPDKKVLWLWNNSIQVENLNFFNQDCKVTMLEDGVLNINMKIRV